MIDFSIKTPQTSNAILFGKFTDEKDSLVDSLRSRRRNTFEEKSKVIDDYSVSSFEEFLEKFSPVIYEEISMNNGKPEFNYSTKPSANSVKIKIKDHQFYKMVEELIRQKADSGKANIEEEIYKSIDELLSPQKAKRDTQKKRKELEQLYNDYSEACEQKRRSVANALMCEITDLKDEIYNEYSDSGLKLLPLYIADKHDKLDQSIKRLELAKNTEDQGEGRISIEGEPKLITGGTFVWGSGGRLEYKEADSITQTQTLSIEQKETPLCLDMKEMAESMESIKNSPEMKQLFVETFSNSQTTQLTLTDENVKNELCELSELVDVYRESQERFIEEIVGLMQKLLDVEMFFRHATGSSDGGKELNGKLIVMNCSLQEAIEEENETEFRNMIVNYHGKVEKRIWFALLPPFEYDNKSKALKGDSKYLSAVTSILAENGIISFFSPQAGPKTDFAHFRGAEDIEMYRNILRSVNKEYTVISNPNFTVIPERQIDRSIVSALTYEGTELQEQSITINPVYVHSSYVAAGLVVASQSPDILRKKGYNINEKYTCARFELEQEYKNFLTEFNLENFFNWPEDFKKELYRKPMGVCFTSDDLVMEGEWANKSYLFYVRNNNGDALYPIMVKEVFIQQFKGQEYTSEKIQADVEEINRITAKHCQDLRYANIFIRTDKGEKVEYIKGKDGNDKLNIVFSELSAPVSLEVGIGKKEDD